MRNSFVFMILFVVAVFTHHSKAETSKTTYRLIISFGSECCGIDHMAQDEIDKFIAAYEKKKKVKLQRKVVYWGKEGERDYCFTLSEISKKEQANLIAEIKTIAKKSKLVEVKENSTDPNEP